MWPYVTFRGHRQQQQRKLVHVWRIVYVHINCVNNYIFLLLLYVVYIYILTSCTIWRNQNVDVLPLLVHICFRLIPLGTCICDDNTCDICYNTICRILYYCMSQQRRTGCTRKVPRCEERLWENWTSSSWTSFFTSAPTPPEKKTKTKARLSVIWTVLCSQKLQGDVKKIKKSEYSLFPTLHGTEMSFGSSAPAVWVIRLNGNSSVQMGRSVLVVFYKQGLGPLETTLLHPVISLTRFTGRWSSSSASFNRYTHTHICVGTDERVLEPVIRLHPDTTTSW